VTDGRATGERLWRVDATTDWTGREILQAVIDGRLPQPPMGVALGYRLVEVGEGFAAFEGEPGPDHLNPAGVVHGGWVLTVIDSATACAALGTLPAGVRITTVETKVNFTRPITLEGGTVRVEGRVVSGGRQIIVCEARARTGDGRVVAHGTSTLLVIPLSQAR
jgi:uncharacterized protein (TIGR00369 family)